MPNWCSNSFYVHGSDKSQVLKFYMDMASAISDNPRFAPVQNSWDKDWVGNLFLGAGYSEQELDQGIDCRGEVTDLELVGDMEGVEISSETAWSPNNESMQRMIDEKYPGLQMVYTAEECGNGIYVNTDVDGIRYRDRFYLEYTLDGDDWDSAYFETEDELIEKLAAILQVPVKEAKRLWRAGKVEDKFESLYNTTEDSEAVICLHEFTDE